MLPIKTERQRTDEAVDRFPPQPDIQARQVVTLHNQRMPKHARANWNEDRLLVLTIRV